MEKHAGINLNMVVLRERNTIGDQTTLINMVGMTRNSSFKVLAPAAGSRSNRLHN